MTNDQRLIYYYYYYYYYYSKARHYSNTTKKLTNICHTDRCQNIGLKNVFVIKLVSILTLTTFCQSGFRSLHSTLTALVDAANSWSVNIYNGLVNRVVFIDLKKAFDTIDHNILLQKFCIYMVLTQSVLSGVIPIFSTEVKDVALLANSLMLHRFHPTG